MQDRTYKFQLSNMRITAVVPQLSAFLMNKRYAPSGTVERILTVHQHASSEMFFITHGKLTVYCGEDVYRAEEGGIILPPRYYHYTVPEEAEGYVMNFSIEPLVPEKPGIFKQVSSCIAQKPFCFQLTDDIRFYAKKVGECLTKGDRDEDILHLLALLFSSLFHTISPLESKEIPAITKRDSYLVTVEDYIARHYCEPIRLPELAAELFLCPRQVSRIIMQEYGCSLSELVNRRRLNVAASLLDSTELSVAEIAASVGYLQESHFYARFRKLYGISPLAFREESRKKRR